MLGLRFDGVFCVFVCVCLLLCFLLFELLFVVCIVSTCGLMFDC